MRNRRASSINSAGMREVRLACQRNVNEGSAAAISSKINLAYYMRVNNGILKGKLFVLASPFSGRRRSCGIAMRNKYGMQAAASVKLKIVAPVSINGII